MGVFGNPGQLGHWRFQWYLGTILDLYGNWQLLVSWPFSQNSLLLSYTWSCVSWVRIWFKMLCFCSFSGEYFTFVEPELWNISVWCFLPLISSRAYFKGFLILSGELFKACLYHALQILCLVSLSFFLCALGLGFLFFMFADMLSCLIWWVYQPHYWLSLNSLQVGLIHEHGEVTSTYEDVHASLFILLLQERGWINLLILMTFAGESS
jgi:hypothetical protein